MSEVDPVEVWRSLRALVVDGLDENRRRIVEVTGLPFSRIRALRRLHAGPLTLAALADAMMVDRPAATVAVDELCRRGLVVRRAHPTDRRRKLVSLTEAGRRTLALVDSIVPVPPPGWTELPAEDLAAVERALSWVSAQVGPGVASRRR
jgi:DNA-binding MarR family transcriptional regulator